LHQLALYPDVQDRLRKEIVDARTAKGDMDLDEIMALPYLDAVVKETLRMYPPVSNVTRM
jgi:cytochrome P450